ncbi:MAG: EAL domain-containing protein [Bacilli bacterium]|nr:EAL domain-containing protein [Bacilli bacterium]
MASERRKTVRLKSLFSRYLAISVGIIALFLIIVILFSILYANTGILAILILLIAISAIFAAFFLAFVILMVKRMTDYYNLGLFESTLENYRRINAARADLEFYPDVAVTEFDELNKQVKQVKETFDNATFIFGELDYSSFNFAPFEGYKGAVTLASFEQSLSNVIAASKNFRNVLAEVYYETGKEGLSKDDMTRLLKRMDEAFESYEGHLLIVPEDQHSAYIYLPRIDSFSGIKDRFDMLLGSIAFSIRSPQGMRITPAHYSIVAYPFSAVHEMFPDLYYAKRQGEISNLYLPNRLHGLGDVSVMKDSMYFNQMSRILYNISAITTDTKNKQEVRAQMSAILDQLTRELRFESAGIVSYNPEVGGYVVMDSVGYNEPFWIGKQVPDRFIESLAQVADASNAYFFSRRRHATGEFAKFCDRFGLESGFLFMIVKNKEPSGFVYLLNRKQRSTMDSYQQEALAAACYHIAASYLIGETIEEAVEARRLFDALLTVSSSATYQIDRDTHKIVSLSDSARKLFPKAEVGLTCHECMWDRKSPCKDCPLKIGDKKVFEDKKGNYAISLALEVKRGVAPTMMITKTSSVEGEADRYDRDLLINSFSSLMEEMDNHYLVGDSGYLLLLRIDNQSDLLAKYGSEGYLLLLRNFIDKCKRVLNGKEAVFRFDQQCLALVLPVMGQVDLLNRVEDIYLLTKDVVYEGDDKYSLDITYLPMNYPQGYATSLDFVRHVYRDYGGKKYEYHVDRVYFDDSDYVRPASRRQFILSVIDEQFGNATFGVNFQPMVNPNTKKIYGAELLLRIQDTYRHIVFNPDELVRVAAANGKIAMISTALMQYLGSSYETAGPALMKQIGFTRLAINTDVSFFLDPNFAKDLEEVQKKFDFPRNFISFEITEKDAFDHADQFIEISKRLQQAHVVLVVDQYSGKYLSTDDVLRLGFSEIKVGRYLVHGIDTNQSKLKDLTLLLLHAKEKHLPTTVVGVENLDQLNLIKDVDPSVNMQGYYFYAPMERNDFIALIRSQ